MYLKTIYNNMSDCIDNFAKEINLGKQIFTLWVEQWHNYSPDYSLTWETISFKKENQSNIPKKKGIYAFLVKPNLENIPNCGFLFYIGETGQDSKGTLRKRYGEYLQEKTKRKRSHIYNFLNRYENFILFSYSTPPPSTNLKSLELKMLDAYMPPLNKTGYSAEVKKAKDAFP